FFVLGFFVFFCYLLFFIFFFFFSSRRRHTRYWRDWSSDVCSSDLLAAAYAPRVPLPTLLLIDVQRAFDDPRWPERNNPEAEARMADLLAAWRETGAPVVHVRHESARPEGLFRRGTDAFEFK